MRTLMKKFCMRELIREHRKGEKPLIKNSDRCDTDNPVIMVKPVHKITTTTFVLYIDVEIHRPRLIRPCVNTKTLLL